VFFLLPKPISICLYERVWGSLRADPDHLAIFSFAGHALGRRSDRLRSYAEASANGRAQDCGRPSLFCLLFAASTASPVIAGRPRAPVALKDRVAIARHHESYQARPRPRYFGAFDKGRSPSSAHRPTQRRIGPEVQVNNVLPFSSCTFAEAPKTVPKGRTFALRARPVGFHKQCPQSKRQPHLPGHPLPGFSIHRQAFDRATVPVGMLRDGPKVVIPICGARADLLTIADISARAVKNSSLTRCTTNRIGAEPALMLPASGSKTKLPTIGKPHFMRGLHSIKLSTAKVGPARSNRPQPNGTKSASPESFSIART